jgi:hypothetical protein
MFPKSPCCAASSRSKFLITSFSEKFKSLALVPETGLKERKPNWPFLLSRNYLVPQHVIPIIDVLKI